MKKYFFNTTFFLRSLLLAAAVMSELLLLTGCEISDISPRKTEGDPETVQAMDKVKFIAFDLTESMDENSMGQRSYALTQKSRLLLNYKKLRDNKWKPLPTKPIRIRVTPINETEKAKAIVSLKACPLLSNWNMAATWSVAHPYPGGDWKTQGGDIEFDDCVSVTPVAATTADSPCASDTASVCFDMSKWFKHYIIEKNVNYGVAIISTDNQSAIEIYGDASGSKGPRIHWLEF